MENYKISGLKLYTFDSTPARGWWFDDQKKAYPIWEKCQKLGVKNIGCHKGIPFGQFMARYAHPEDLDAAADDFRDLNFIAYHSAWPYHQELAALGKKGFKPHRDNLYCEIGSTFLPGLVADSTLNDLTDSIADLKPELRGWRVTEYLGRSYAIPWMLGTRAMYMNADLMRGVGLPPENPPTTWTDFARAVEQIDAAGPDLKGFGMNAGEREVLFKKFMPFAWGNGGDILDSTLTHSVVYSPQNVEALRFYLSLKPFSLLDRQEMLDEAFTRGRIGFTISGPWMLRKLPESAPQLHFGVILMPRPGKDRGTPASFAGAEALGVFRDARRVLTEELGIEPWPMLRELERARRSGSSAARRRSRRRSRWRAFSCARRTRCRSTSRPGTRSPPRPPRLRTPISFRIPATRSSSSSFRPPSRRRCIRAGWRSRRS